MGASGDDRDSNKNNNHLEDLYRVYEISLERQEVTELCRGFLVRMRIGAFNPKRERKQSEIAGQVTWHLL